MCSYKVTGWFKMSREKYSDKLVLKKRMLFVFSILFVFLFLLVIRLSYVMIHDAPKLSNIAKAQWTSEVTIDAKRGRILDNSLHELAVSANVYRIDFDMKSLKETEKKMSKETISQKLAAILNMDQNKVLKKLNATLPNGLPLASINLVRRIDKDQADKVRDLKINGVLISADTKRYYPEGNFLAQVLGHTNSDGQGLTGVELQYNNDLAGLKGIRIAELDSNRTKELPDTISDFTKPVDGKDVILTIDSMIQHFCEKAAQQALTDNKAKAVRVIAMDPKTGEILAMVNKPDYDPNNPWVAGKSSDELNQIWRNNAVSDTFEPGSIFKIVTAVAAMEKGVVKESDTFVCNGAKSIGKETIHCWKTTGHGTQNFVQILENSCNVGFMDVGEKLGANNLCEYINKLGFGQLTGVDLPGEAKGIVKKANQISAVDLATMSFGQTNTVSSIQYITMLNAVANGGYLITPHIMKYIGHYDSNTGKEIVDKAYNNYNKRQVLDTNIVTTLRGYLEKVVSEGGGSKAYIEGYHIAGKTGTAKKVGTHGYAEGKYIASFAGMAPASDPKITLLISIDEPDPSNYYAGQIAAPVAKQIFYDIFNYWALQPDASGEKVAKSLLKDVIIPNIRGLKKDEAIKQLKGLNIQYDLEGSGEYVTDVNPVPGYTVKEGTKITISTGNQGSYSKVVVVPNLRGYTQEKASEILNNLGIKYSFTGTGVVVDQSIEPGVQVSKGTNISLDLDPLGD